MCSTSQPKKVSSSAIRQYSQRKSERWATRWPTSEVTGLFIEDITASTGFCQPHQVFQLQVMIEFGLFIL